MVDYELDGDFHLVTTSWGAVKDTDGLREFEQTLAILLSDKMDHIIGQTSSADLIPNKIRLAVTRVAKEYEMLDEVDEVVVAETNTPSQEYQVTIYYNSDEPFIKVF